MKCNNNKRKYDDAFFNDEMNFVEMKVSPVIRKWENNTKTNSTRKHVPTSKDKPPSTRSTATNNELHV